MAEESGRSEDKKRLFGPDYTKHHDEEGRKSGYSGQKEGFSGSKYIEHYDEEGNVIGRTGEREEIFGDKYPLHEYSTLNDESGSAETSGCVIGIIAISAILAVMLAAIVWLPMVVVSSIATYVFAEGMKQNATWTIQVQNLMEKIEWFGPAIAGIVGFFLLIFVEADPGQGKGFLGWFVGLLGMAAGLGASWYLSRKILRWRL